MRWFGCSHKNRSFPITLPKSAYSAPSTYVVCFDCGREMAYDWETMKLIQPTGGKSGSADQTDSADLT